MLSLSDTFCHALTQEMQADMLQHKFVMPLTSRGLTKSEQLSALHDVRTAATRSHEREILAKKAIEKQVQATLGQPNLNTLSNHNLNDNNNTLQPGQDHNIDNGHDSRMQVYAYRSQAEQTMQKYGGNERIIAPGNYMQQYEMRDGKRFPKHPAPPHATSDFPIDHRGCYYCGDRHEFRDYPKNRSMVH